MPPRRARWGTEGVRGGEAPAAVHRAKPWRPDLQRAPTAFPPMPRKVLPAGPFAPSLDRRRWRSLAGSWPAGGRARGLLRVPGARQACAATLAAAVPRRCPRPLRAESGRVRPLSTRWPCSLLGRKAGPGLPARHRSRCVRGPHQYQNLARRGRFGDRPKVLDR